ncbi:unnamed protein product [Anisakis simplex]|uniref:Uncharacterized protein n=1 Tax=Anisakis simplex TaxID=6269 RepID=A0A0M3JMN1_ANISI|nr:unnamed protein product [Anisakis simplex]
MIVSIKQSARVCCTSIVYATDKKQTKVEFPEARIYEEAMNVLLFEERHLCARCGGDAGRCSPPRAFSSQQLLSASFANQQPNSSSVSVRLIA